jgi:hypothetical protein
MSQQGSQDDQVSSAESGEVSGELGAEPSVKRARIAHPGTDINPTSPWNDAQDDSTGMWSTTDFCEHCKEMWSC